MNSKGERTKPALLCSVVWRACGFRARLSGLHLRATPPHAAGLFLSQWHLVHGAFIKLEEGNICQALGTVPGAGAKLKSSSISFNSGSHTRK